MFNFNCALLCSLMLFDFFLVDNLTFCVCVLSHVGLSVWDYKISSLVLEFGDFTCVCVFLTILTKIFDLKTIVFFSGKRYIFKSYYSYSIPFFVLLWNYIIWILDTIHLSSCFKFHFIFFSILLLYVVE